MHMERNTCKNILELKNAFQIQILRKGTLTPLHSILSLQFFL